MFELIKVGYLKIGFVLLLLLFGATARAETKADKIGSLLEAANRKNEFSGAVLVAVGDKIVFKGAVGAANRQWNAVNATATRFRICSITKQFTAMLVMQLVESGKIKLDAAVFDYLPDFRKDTGAKVTIRNLLHSASGLPSLPETFYVNENAQAANQDFVIKRYLGADLAFNPGDKFNYNNADFIVLGAIIEKATGKSYETILSEQILQPLKLKNTGLLRNKLIVSDLASGYSFKDECSLNESFVQIQNFGAAGAMYSTVEDLYLWDKALLQNKLLSKKLTDEMFAPSAKLGFVALGSWSYELKLPDNKKHRFVERQGYTNGFCALNIISPEDKISLVLLSNLETQTLFQTYVAKGLSYEILAALTAAE